MPEAKADAEGAFKLSNPSAFTDNMIKAMGIMAQIAETMAGQAKDPGPGKSRPVSGDEMIRTFTEVAKTYGEHPDKAIAANLELWRAHSQLWQNAWRRFLGETVEPAAGPDATDRRFKDAQWSENQVFDFLKQSYLITTRWAHDALAGAGGLDEHTRHKAEFYAEQIGNALSPSNFALTNPEVLRMTLETNGQNLVDGLGNLARDIQAGNGELRIRQTDFSAFEVGKNLAMTPGKVVYQNDIIQLIQYAPTTEKVKTVPLLIVPPWINKFYILDLNPKKSFIRWAVSQGLTVFVVSWVNPDESQATKTFGNYMREGIFSALDAIEQATGQRRVNTVGYCVGGTLLAASLGVMAANGDDRIRGATFFTTQVDFEQAGDLKVFVDEEQLAGIERHMAQTGYLEGSKMASAFNLLRSNDLIWSYVVNNYLKGKEPMPFDLLYWNGDSTRMPAALHSYYLRECYLHNHMSAGKMVIDGVRIDLSRVKTPIYNLAAREDHIAPLPSVFKVGRYFGGDTRLVVAGSGHIAGVVNPPEAKKYQYWTNTSHADTLEEWLAGAHEHAGSWWPDWAAWVKKRSGASVSARQPGDGKLDPIEDAPGSYVRMRD